MAGIGNGGEADAAVALRREVAHLHPSNVALVEPDEVLAIIGAEDGVDEPDSRVPDDVGVRKGQLAERDDGGGVDVLPQVLERLPGTGIVKIHAGEACIAEDLAELDLELLHRLVDGEVSGQAQDHRAPAGAQ